MKVISMHKAKSTLSQLVQRAAVGETILIGAYGKVDAKLVAATLPTVRQKRIGQLNADVQVLRVATAESGFIELPVLGIHTETLAKLPMLHRDPFDRLIVSQAITEPMRLLTSDSELEAYSDLVQRI